MSRHFTWSNNVASEISLRILKVWTGRSSQMSYIRLLDRCYSRVKRIKSCKVAGKQTLVLFYEDASETFGRVYKMNIKVNQNNEEPNWYNNILQKDGKEWHGNIDTGNCRLMEDLLLCPKRRYKSCMTKQRTSPSQQKTLISRNKNQTATDLGDSTRAHWAQSSTLCASNWERADFIPTVNQYLLRLWITCLTYWCSENWIPPIKDDSTSSTYSATKFVRGIKCITCAGSLPRRNNACCSQSLRK